jgi:alpha-ketoglutarate-dependent taurine dioxygenase
MAVTQVLRPSPYKASVDVSSAHDSSKTTTFPLALSRAEESTLEDVVKETAQLASSGRLTQLLDEHEGAIYFKNLGLKTAEDFSQFAHAFGWTAHEDIGNPVRRTIHAKNVATANEGPNTQPVYPHNEFGLSLHYPSFVLFYCASAPETGTSCPLTVSVVHADNVKVERHRSTTLSFYIAA